MPLKLTLADFHEARATIDGLVHRTPLLSSRSLSERLGLEVWLKAECLQKTGSFKIRGAFNTLRHMPDEDRARGVITASTGNHGQAVAYAAAHEGVPCVIALPQDTDENKVAAVREYNAEVVLHGQYYDDAHQHAMQLAAERGMTYLDGVSDPYIAPGQGTMSLEIFEDLPAVEVLLVGIGGGALIAGVAGAIKLLKPDVRVIGVEPVGCATYHDSRAAGKPIKLPEITTIADGLTAQEADPGVFAAIEQTVDDIVLVEDSDTLDAVRFLLERTKLLTEPAGAATVAALLTGTVALPAGTKTVALLSGGNYDVRNRLDLGY